MDAFPPEGVSVIISSDTVTVTNQTVDLGTAEEGRLDPVMVVLMRDLDPVMVVLMRDLDPVMKLKTRRQ